MVKLTKPQREMLERARMHTHGGPGFDGATIFDGREANIASRLADKGLVHLPAGHGYVFGGPNGVTITEAGRAALKSGAPDA